MNVHSLVSAMADGSPPKRQTTEDAETDGQVYPLPPEICAHIFSFLPTADLHYVALATTVFRDLAYYELAKRLQRSEAVPIGRRHTELVQPHCRGDVHPCCAGVRANGAFFCKWTIYASGTSIARFFDRFRDLNLEPGFRPQQYQRLATVAAASGAVDLLEILETVARGHKYAFRDQAIRPNGALERVAEAYGQIAVFEWLVKTERPGSLAPENLAYMRENAWYYGAQAAFCGRLRFIEWLIDNGPAPDAVRPCYLFERAILGNQHRVIHWFLRRGVVYRHDHCASYTTHGISDMTMRLLHGGPFEQLSCMEPCCDDYVHNSAPPHFAVYHT
jgi:hypothetical protein